MDDTTARVLLAVEDNHAHTSPAFRGVCYLTVCSWSGPERATRHDAHDDAVAHVWAVPGSHHIDVLTQDGTPARLAATA